MRFPYLIQRSIDKHIDKEVRKNLCREESNLVLKFKKGYSINEEKQFQLNKALQTIYSNKEDIYAKFKDWDNYNLFHRLSIEKSNSVVEYKTKIWKDFFSQECFKPDYSIKNIIKTLFARLSPNH